MWGIIATWRMALDGVKSGAKLLDGNKTSKDALIEAIRMVEDEPSFHSVGYGGLPNKNGQVELDAAYMNGDNLNIGAVASVKDIKNPIKVAEHLSHLKFNNFLVGDGAESYASSNGFEKKNMLTKEANDKYLERAKKVASKELTPYDGHDTVGMVALDLNGNISAGTSTSGLFFKEPGRVGDSPVIGAGLYADSKIGAATATGLGEDMLKGAISYEVVRLMEEGMTPQEACDTAVIKLDKKLRERRGKAGDISVIAINKDGEFGVGTNIEDFSFVAATKDLEPTVFVASRGEDGKAVYEKATEEWLKEHPVE